MSAVLAEKTVGGIPEGRLEWHFDNWRRWMRKDDVTDGAPHKAAGFIPGGNSQTFDEMVDAADVRCARIVDALVSSLSISERAAINHCYLYAVYRLREPLEVTLERARRRVAQWLYARGVY